MSIERTIANRYLRSKRKQSFISLISIITVSGIALGVAALIIVLAVMSGFQKNLREKLLGNNPHIVIRSYSGNIQNWKELVENLKNIKAVKSVDALVMGEVLGVGPRSSQGLRVMGIDFEEAIKNGYFSEAFIRDGVISYDDADRDLAKGAVLNTIIDFKKWKKQKDFLDTEGDFSEDLNFNPEENYEEDLPMVLVGDSLAIMLGVSSASYNKNFKLISPFGRITPLGNTAPLTRTFQTMGTFQTGFVDQDSFTLYMDLEEAQKFLGTSSGVSAINIKVNEFNDVKKVKQLVEEKINSDEFWVIDWLDNNVQLFAALELEQKAMFVILTLIILVASFSIVSTLIMMVMEKKKDIAILKSMGASHKQIKKIFTHQGLTVGLLGTAVGFILGLFVCFLLKNYKIIELPYDLYLMDRLLIDIRPLHLILTVVISIVISYLATLYPASQAAKMDPVEALRYE